MADQLEVEGLVDHEQGLVSREIFVDEEIYRLEMERVFGRCWLYLAHESQVPEPGDFVASYMGEDRVIVSRDQAGKIHAFLNLCPGCSSLIIGADEGRVEHFRCPGHGWQFDLAGALIYPDAPDDWDEADAERWGLPRVAQLDSYKGLIFATFDPGAPSLDTYLGDIRWGLDLLLEQGPLVVAGTNRWVVNCNWKFAAESSVSDLNLYQDTARLSGTLARDGEQSPAQAEEQGYKRTGFTVITEYGHGINAEFIAKSDEDKAGADDPLLSWRRNPATQGRLGMFRMRVRRGCVTIFPNVVISTAARQLYVWQPRGPTRIEATLVAFSDVSDSPEARRAFARAVQRFAGPAGLLGQDESEAWEQSTRLCRSIVARRQPLNYQMGLGHGELVDDELSPPRIETLVNEHRQLWFYRNWARALDAPTWQAWQQTRLHPPARL